MDGLDGPPGSSAPRRSRQHREVTWIRGGGFLDITADFAVYGATVVGVAIGATRQYDAN